MKFLRIDFYDNDFSGIFQHVGIMISRYFCNYYNSCDSKIEWNEELLNYLRPIVIKIASSEAYLKSLEVYARSASFYKESPVNYSEYEFNKIIKNKKEIYEKCNYEEYFSKTKLSIIDVDLEDIEWNNYETVYIPLKSDVIKVFCQ